MWNQHRANDAKEGMIPSLGRCWADESADHELMWDQRWAYYGKQGIDPSSGRCWAVEFADVEPRQNRHWPMVQNLMDRGRLPASGRYVCVGLKASARYRPEWYLLAGFRNKFQI